MNQEDHKFNLSHRTELFTSANSLASNRKLQIQEEIQDGIQSNNQTIDEINPNRQSKIYLKFNHKKSQQTEQYQFDDSPKRQKQQEDMNVVKIPTRKRQKKCLVFLFIFSLIVILTIGLCFGIMALNNIKKPKIIKKCYPGFFNLNGNCTFFNADVFTLDDIEQSLPGQEKNIITIIKKKNNLETYQYTITNNQISQNMEDGSEVEASNTEIHNVGFLTKEITNTTFSVICMLLNSTLYDQYDQPQFIDGYPGTDLLPVLLEWNGDGELSDIINPFQDENSDQQLDGEILDTMSNWQIQDSQQLGVNKEDYFMSQIPVIFLEISKSGELLNVEFPVNLRKSFKQMLPFILEQYSPLLSREVYSKVTAVNHGQSNRRILQEQDVLNYKKNEFGDYSQNHTAHFPASEKNSLTTGELDKNYGQSSSSQGGTTIQQEQQLSQSSKIKGGQLTNTKTNAQMNVSNPPIQELEEDETEDGVERGENVQETQNLMGDIKIDQETDFILLENRLISKNSTEFINMSQIGSITRSMDLVEYQDLLQEEMDYDNIQNEKIYDEMDLETIVDDDGEVQNLNAYLEDGEIKLLRRALEQAGKQVVAPIQFKLFQFNVLGMKIKKELVFQCKEGRNKDDCYLKPTLHLGSLKIPLISLKVKAQISKVVRKLNWFKRNVYDKAIAIVEIIDEELTDIIESSDTIIEEVLEFLDPETNPIIVPFENTLDNFQNLIDGTYNELVLLINETTDLTFLKFGQYITDIKSKVIKFVHEKTDEVQHTWDNLQNSLNFNLDELNQLINSDQYPQIPIEVCDNLSVASDTFQEFSLIQNNLASTFIENILELVLFEPMNTILSKFPALSTVFEDEIDGEVGKIIDEELDQLKIILLNIANSMISSVIIEPINKLLQEQVAFQKISYLLQSQILDISYDINQKLSQLQTTCYQKSSSSVQLSDIQIDQFSTLLDINQFIDLPIFSVIQDGQNIVSFLTNDLQDAMETEYQNHLEEINKLYLRLKNFSSSLKHLFTGGVKDIINNIKNLTTDVKDGVLETKDTLVNATLEIVQSSKDLIFDIKDAIKKGDRNDNQLEGGEFDILEIVDQVKGIIELKHLVTDATRTFSKLKKVPDNFEKMVDYFENLIKKPDEIISFQKIDLGRIKFFNEKDILMLFNNMFTTSNDEMGQTYEKEVQTKVKTDTLTTIETDVVDISDSFTGNMEESLFQEAGFLDGSFKEKLAAILSQIEIPRTTLFSKTLYEYNYIYAYYYLTPIFVPLEVSFSFNARASADVDFGIKDSAISLGCSLIGKVWVQAQGGISVIIAKLVAYVRAVLFEGRARLQLSLGFTQRLFGRALAELQLKALEIQAGIGVSWIQIRFEWICIRIAFIKICIPIPIVSFSEVFDLIPPFIFKGFEYNLVLFDLQI